MEKLSKITLFDFTHNRDSEIWKNVDDTVMGGISRSSFHILPDSTALFTGEVSLENNGGFASVWTIPMNFPVVTCSGIQLKVMGDGKIYRLRFRTENNQDGVSYQIKFRTIANQWNEVSLAFEDAQPTFRGRFLPDMPPLNPEEIKQIGFLISDKQAGRFKLKIDWIKAY